MTKFRTVVMIILLLGSAVVAGVSGAQSSTETSSAFQNSGAPSGMLYWTNQTEIATDVSSADLSDATSDGHLFAAYQKGGSLRLAELSTRGKLIDDQRLPTSSGNIQGFEVAASADGYVTVLYRLRDDLESSESIRRILLDPDGNVVSHSEVVSSSGPDEEYTLRDPETDSFGRVHALIETQRGEAMASADLYTFSRTGSGYHTKNVVTAEAQGGLSIHANSRVESRLAVRNDRVLVAYVSNYQRSNDVRGPERYELGQLRYVAYRSSENGVRRTSSVKLQGERADLSYQNPLDGEVSAVALHPEGYAILTYRGLRTHPSSDRLRTVLFSGNEAGRKYEPRERAREIFVRPDGSVYVNRGNQYTVYHQNGTVIRQSAEIQGLRSWAINRDGYPSVLRLQDGRLTYQGLVANAGKEVGDLYAEFDSVNEALQQRVTELEANAEANVTVVVKTADGDREYSVGDTVVFTVQGENADAEELSVRYDGETYEPEGGRVEVQLASAGTNQFGVSYGDVTKSVSLDVEERGSDAGMGDESTSESDEDGVTDEIASSDTDASSSSTPGFTLVGSVVALILALAFGLRIRGQRN